MKKTDVSNLVTNWNIQAMKYLKLGNPFCAFNLLQKANRLLSTHKSLVELHMVTLNNLGCYYKWIKKPKEALKQFENSACLRKLHLVDPISLAGTYLNISTLHSDLGSHNLALKFSQDAIDVLKTGDQSSGKLKITLSMAYHSLANEYYNLKNYQESLINFEKALDLAQKSQNTEKLVEFIKNSLKKLDKRIGNEEKPENSEVKTLPSIKKTVKSREKQINNNLNPIANTRYRFLTGDRLKPMFPQSVSPIVEKSNINQTLENIQKKIDLLQIRLEGFHSDIKPLIEVEAEDLSETFSPRTIEGFKIFNDRNKAAKVIQKNFRQHRKREKTA